ncbi:MAG TPA: hypothetical protein DD666_00680 [Advenella kashmirensis]|uniref:Transmembrane protein n=1 Tax=Advenella kashmirensis TaxID=310575 RepID=A0A356LAG4_9BURK|nr:hypothetical protein [Advenella kashmirensis]
MATIIALFGSVFVLWSLLAWFAGAVFCSTVATAKNLNPLMWFLGGLLFPVIALIAVAGMPAALTKEEKRRLSKQYERLEQDGPNLKSVSSKESASTPSTLTVDNRHEWPDGPPIKKDFSIPNWVFYVGIVILIFVVFGGVVSN